MSVNVEAIRTTLATRAEPDQATISYLPKGGAQIAYVGHAEITRMLLEADPEWTWEPQAWDPAGGPLIIARGTHLVLWGFLTLHGKRIPCVGTCEAKKQEADKELIGDLIRNGAMRFGISLNLWSKAEKASPVEPDTVEAPAPRPVEAPPRSAHAVEVMAEALDCTDPVNEPPAGLMIESWKWKLAEKSDDELDALNWEAVGSSKNANMKKVELLDRAQGLARELKATSPTVHVPDNLGEIHGMVATELRRFLLSSDKPF